MSKSTSELVTGIVGTIDIGSLVANVLNLTIDIQQAKKISSDIEDYINSFLRKNQKDLVTLAKLGYSDIINRSNDRITSQLVFMIDEIYSQLGLSATGSKMASSMRGQEAKIHNALESTDLYTDVMFSIPQNIIRLKAERYYMKLIAPNFPSERDAYLMTVNKFWSDADFLELLQETQGLTLADSKAVLTIRKQTIGKPSLHDAWSMVQKGLKPLKYFLDLAVLGQGWTEKDAEALNSLYDYDFSPSEIMRMSDFVPMETAWVKDKLTKIGMNEADRNVFIAALEKRIVRDELNKEYGLLLDNFSWGLLTSDALEAFLTDSKFSATEIEYRLETAELMKDKVRLKLLRDAEIYLYRKDFQNEDLLLTALQDLGIEIDIANAIVRNEAAKKGIEWEMSE